MLQLSKSYKEICDKDLNNGVFSFEQKSNTPIKLTESSKNIIFRFVEKEKIDQSSCGKEPIDFEETLDVSVCLSKGNLAILGSECYSHELCKSDDVRATDLLYIFLSSENSISKCCCHIYDLKRKFGGAPKDVVRFYDQCVSTAKYALTICYETNFSDDGSGFYNANLHFGLITEEFEENILKSKIDGLKKEPINPISSFGKKMLAQGRQNSTVVDILERILNKKIKFNGKLFDLDIRIMDKTTHMMSLMFNDDCLVTLADR